ncbi:MAG: BatA domain-containing protein, partial [Pseudomonadota bacterium]
MFGLGSLGFVAPAVLLGLIALPVLWWLLRAIPPSPKTEIFPGVRLLLGLDDPEREAERTPWWLLLLRVVAIGAVIIGFAQPLLNPSQRLADSGEGPVLVLMDAGWASAPDWQARRAAAAATIEEAGRDGRPVILWRGTVETLAPPGPMAAAEARAAIEAMRPEALRPDRAAVLALLDDPAATPPGETLWLHDGLAHEAEASAALAERLADFGPLTLIGPEAPAMAVLPPRLEEGSLVATVIRTADQTAPDSVTLAALAAADGAGERRIAVANADFAAGAEQGEARFDLPSELIGTVSRITLTEAPSPGGTALADAAVRRVPVAVVDPSSVGEVAPLTSARHYLTQALEPHADVRAGTLADALEREPSAIFLADYGTIDGTDREALETFLQDGGLLVRFAGPRLAGALAANTLASQSVAGADPLLPVRLRRGGRTLGGALAWGDPRTLGPFDPDGPFRRLLPPDEVDVRTQVLADPSPDLT